MKNSNSILNFIHTILIKVADFSVQSHLIIALATFCMCLETFIFVGGGLILDYAIIAASGSIVFYGIHRFFQIKKYRNIPSGRIEKLKKYRLLNLISIICSGLVFIFLFIESRLFTHWYIVVVFALSGLYILPLLPGKNRVRDLPYIKIFLISVFWMLITACIPVVLSGSHFTNCILMYLAERFVFIMFITIPFDIRDIADDRMIGLKTMVTTWGFKTIKRAGLIIGLMGIAIIVTCLFMNCLSTSFFIALILSYILAFSFFLYSSPKVPNNFYSVMVDGIMIIRYLIIIILI